MNSHSIKLILIHIFAGLLLSGTVEAENKKNQYYIEFNTYPYLEDVKSDPDLTINSGVNLSNGFSYFGFANFRHVFRENDAEFLFTEQNFRWRVSDKLPVDVAFQAAIRRGGDNDRFRLGFRWYLNQTPFIREFLAKIHLIHQISFYAKTFDAKGDDVWQMEHFFFMKFPYISDRLYLLGFLDHTFNLDVPAGTPTRPIISEMQLGMRLFKGLHAIAEYRVNENRRSDVNNFAVGLEYKFRW